MRLSHLQKDLTSEIAQKKQQLKQKLFQGHLKSIIRNKNGIVFIGNSRIGKSTLAAILNAIKMNKTIFGGSVVIEPIEEKYKNQKNLIQHTFQSVTSFPNIRQMNIDGQNYTTVDLPGFMDSSYQKQLCNWSYIKDIIKQLQKILFVVVLQVHSQTLKLGDDEINMMKRFMEAFPSGGETKPKQNVCMVVNFVQGIETEQKQNAKKEKIMRQIDRQLKELYIIEKPNEKEQIYSDSIQNGQSQQQKQPKKLCMYNFYSKSIQSDRLILIERAKKDPSMLNNNNNRQQYKIPKLTKMIKSNLNKLQKAEKSQYKIDLNSDDNQNHLLLREVIKELKTSAFKDIRERVAQYKNFFSEMLELLSQTEGVTCDHSHYGRLENYQFLHKLNKFSSIELPKQYLSKNLSMSSSYFSPNEPIQQSVFEMVELFNKMKIDSKFQTINQGLDNLIKKIMLFFRVLQKFSQKMFDGSSFKNFLNITQNFKKAIYIDYQDLLVLKQNVSNFNIIKDPNDSSTKVKFYEQFYDSLSQMYSEIMRIRDFKVNLTRYFETLLKKYNNQHVSKINQTSLQRLRECCELINMQKLSKECLLLIYRTCHQKLLNPNLKTNLQLSDELIQRLKKIRMSPGQLKDVEAWKEGNQQWQSIKGKNMLFLLKLLSQTGYTNKQELLEFYFTLDTNYDEILVLLKNIIQQVQNDNFNRLTAYDLCFKAKQIMMKSWFLTGAMTCCKLAEKLYYYQDKKRVVQAQRGYNQVLRLLISQSPSDILDEINEFEAHKEIQPWLNVDEKKYDSLLEIVYAHTTLKMNKQKSINSDKNISLFKSIIDYGKKLSENSCRSQQESRNTYSPSFLSSPSINQQQKHQANRHMKVESPCQIMRQRGVSAFEEKSEKQLMSEKNEKKVQQNKQSPSQQQVKKFKAFKTFK